MQTPHNANLRSLAEQRGIMIGAAANARALRTDYAYRELLAQEFNLLTPENEMKYGPLSPHPGAYDFGPAEELIAFAKANYMNARGHTLVWHQQNPDWLKEANYTHNQALDLLHRHVFTTMGHFHGEIYAWDVINEPIEANGGLRDTFWLRTIGPEYLECALRFAHEADPHAKLFINDYGVEGINPKSNSLYELLADLRKRDVPIHGVGLQMHVALGASKKGFPPPPTVSELFDNMRRLGELGLEVHITEMDVQIADLEGLSDAERLEQQAACYSQILHTALRCPQFKAMIFWGFTDRHSWIPHFTQQADAPLPFDTYYQPKPAYDALYRVLESA